MVVILTCMKTAFNEKLLTISLYFVHLYCTYVTWMGNNQSFTLNSRSTHRKVNGKYVIRLMFYTKVSS